MNPQEIILSTYYDTDKIVFTQSGSASIATLPNEYSAFGFTIKKLEIPHGMPRPVFVDFRFSLDGGSTWRTGGAAEDCMAYSNSTNIVLLVMNGVSGTLHYQVFGSWINDYDTNNPTVPEVNTASDTYFDSRLNYRKIVKQGMKTVTTADLGGSWSGTVAIPHGFATTTPPTFIGYFTYRNAAEVWQLQSGGTQNPWDFLAPNSAQVNMYADNTNIYINTLLDTSNTPVNVWYKVFGDE